MKWNILGLAAAGVVAIAGLTGCDEDARGREARMNNRMTEMQLELDGKISAVNNEIVMLRANPPVVTAPAPPVQEQSWERLGVVEGDSWKKAELDRIRAEQRASLNAPPARTTAPTGSLAAKHIRINQDVRTVQTALKGAGFYQGAIDGKVGKQTIAAIEGFQRSQGLVADGVVGAKTWAMLAHYAG